MSQKKPSGGKSYLPFVIIGVVLVAALAVAALMFRPDTSNQRTPSSSNLNATPDSNATQNTNRAASTITQPASAVPRGAPGAQPPHTHGDANAAVTLEEFGDYQCPPCGLFHGELKKMEARYGSRLRVVFRNLPLDKIHPHAKDAARAAEAAALQGKFWPMHDMLYNKQEAWKDASDVRGVFATYAGTLGLDVERFKLDMDGSTVSQRIAADLQRADSLGVSGTPTIFVNGREIGGASMADIVKNVHASIDAAMTGKLR